MATSPRLRLLGLAWLDPDLAPAGLLIPRCRSIHTFGMRFRIDVVFLGQGGRVIRVVEAVGRGRLLAESAATGVLEIGGGTVAERGPRNVGSVATPASRSREETT